MTIVNSLHRLLALTLLIGCSLPAQADHAGSGRQFEHSLAPAERAQLQQELYEYSDRSYPDRQRLESRRQQMRERQQQRIESQGGITRQDARQSAPWLERRFHRIDRNGDGVISEDELGAARDRRR